MHPIVGVGPDNLSTGIRYNITEESDNFKYIVKYNIDKAHNEYLHIAVTMGIPAFILYMTFLCILILPKLKTSFTNKKDFVLFCMIISYMAQAFFNISTIGIAPIFWLILGLYDNKNLMLKNNDMSNT